MARGRDGESESGRAVAWFQCQLAVKTRRELARNLGVNATIVSRNAARLRKGKHLTRSFSKRIESIL